MKGISSRLLSSLWIIALSSVLQYLFLQEFAFLVIAAKPKPKSTTTHSTSSTKPKPLRLNVDILPPLLTVLEELDLKDYVKEFIRIGVTETRLLLRLSSMDFQMMMMDWLDFNEDKLQKLKVKIQQLLDLATIHEEPDNPELDLRKKLHYGRIYLQNAVTSYEFQLASFGGFPAIGWQSLDVSPSGYECTPSVTSEIIGEPQQYHHQQKNYNQRLVLVKRGICPFVEKALNAFHQNASGIIIINNDDKIESPSSGIGIYPNITDAMIAPLKHFTVLSVANASGEPLLRSVQFHQEIHVNNHPKAAVVPLKCHTGGKCLPVTKEEANFNHEIAWGKLRITAKSGRQSKSFEFLTSNFGGDLPVNHEYPLEYGNPIDLCDISNNRSVQLETDIAGETAVSSTGPVVVNQRVLVAHRGNCRFDIKTLNAQSLGARILIVIDMHDQPLQRLGGAFPEVGYIGIPSVLVTAEVAQFLESLSFTADSPATNEVVVEFTPKIGSEGFDNWIEIAGVEWAENTTDRLLQLQGLIQKYQQTEHHDIVSWLNRRVQEIESSRRLPIETDAS